ncbi:3-hydroxyisobutyryl-CoA hydrolase 1 [Rhynchospora pubera]|uniref:3-hydroxyisobutyryl-CoA hydrolase n=1 Tax=Rhynchospora pubera TaxID=906938 RepID=A0AAV8H6Z8_9POAL|nr:3-hydroxyisobutyryl-CoA hydrolase 1 [Rhynchospora pubera]
MASPSFAKVLMEENTQILEERNARVKTITLNRPQKFNALTHKMILQLLKEFKEFEADPSLKILIVKGKGRALCSGGDVPIIFMLMTEGHWIFAAHYYVKLLTLCFSTATLAKPVVFLLNGVVMGAGAGFSLMGKFRVATENTVHGNNGLNDYKL